MKDIELICVSKIKKYALDYAKNVYKTTPSYIPTRVSKDFLISLDLKLKGEIQQFIISRPKKGLTI